MPPKFTKSLADDLNHICNLEVMEAEHQMLVNPGQIAIAPGGSQMRVVRQGNQALIEITDDPPERNCKPSVDYMFASLANHYGDEAMAAVLTGMGDDGTLGCKLLNVKVLESWFKMNQVVWFGVCHEPFLKRVLLMILFL